jgi:O-antigen ligase
VVAIVACVPLIVYGKYLELNAIEFENWKGITKHLDLFNYYKALLFVFLTVCSVLALFYLVMIKGVALKKTAYYVPIGVYLLFVVLSFVFSEYRETAARGFVDQYQGVWVLLSYGLIIVATKNLVRREKHVVMLTRGYIFASAVVAAIGSAQFFGFDVFQSEFGRMLILPTDFHHLAETLRFTFVEFNVNSTLYNSNYTGSYAGLVFPLFLALYARARNGERVFYGVLCMLVFVIWLGSNSRAAYIGLLCGLILLAYLFRRNLFARKRQVLVLTALLAAVFLSMNAVSGGKIAKRFASIDLSSVFEVDEDRIWFENISVDGNEIFVNAGDLVLIVRYEDGRLFVSHFEDAEVYFARSAYAVRPTYMNFQGVHYALHPERRLLEMVIAGKELRFALIDGQFKARTRSGQSYSVVTPERLALFDRRENLASSRGYIWSRAVPMLKKTLLLGYGPDLFVAYFPKGDIAGKLNAFGRFDQIVSKPHNQYLQIALNTGVVSLIAFLALYGAYVVESLRLYARNGAESYIEQVGIGVFAGVFSYLVTGLFNDHTISVAPSFFVMTGLGLAINEFVRKGIWGRTQIKYQ